MGAGVQSKGQCPKPHGWLLSLGYCPVALAARGSADEPHGPPAAPSEQGCAGGTVPLPSLGAAFTSLGPRAVTMTFPSPLGPASNPWRRGEVAPSPSCRRQPCHRKRLPCPCGGTLLPGPLLGIKPPSPPHARSPRYLWGHAAPGGSRVAVPQSLAPRVPAAPGCIPCEEGGGAAAPPSSAGPGGAPSGVRLARGGWRCVPPCHLVRLYLRWAVPVSPRLPAPLVAARAASPASGWLSLPRLAVPRLSVCPHLRCLPACVCRRPRARCPPVPLSARHFLGQCPAPLLGGSLRSITLRDPSAPLRVPCPPRSVSRVPPLRVPPPASVTPRPAPTVTAFALGPARPPPIGYLQPRGRGPRGAEATPLGAPPCGAFPLAERRHPERAHVGQGFPGSPQGPCAARSLWDPTRGLSHVPCPTHKTRTSGVSPAGHPTPFPARSLSRGSVGFWGAEPHGREPGVGWSGQQGQAGTRLSHPAPASPAVPAALRPAPPAGRAWTCRDAGSHPWV